MITVSFCKRKTCRGIWEGGCEFGCSSHLRSNLRFSRHPFNDCTRPISFHPSDSSPFTQNIFEREKYANNAKESPQSKRPSSAPPFLMIRGYIPIYHTRTTSALPQKSTKTKHSGPLPCWRLLSVSLLWLRCPLR
jgi:hypothetical protein